MIFKEWEMDKILEGTKTQMRYVVMPNERAGQDGSGNITAVYDSGKLPKWLVGLVYPVRSDAVNGSAGYIHILVIRRERLQDITYSDAKKEGVENRTCPYCKGRGYFNRISHGRAARPSVRREECKNCFLGYLPETRVEEYRWLWDRSHTAQGERWEDNPEVWVLEFERV